MADFDPSTPSIARVYDYFLGGRDNFAADRELAQRLIDVFPPIPTTVRENKQFLHRAVTWVAREGIGHTRRTCEGSGLVRGNPGGP